MKCKNCNTEHDGFYGSGDFCCEKCTKSYATKKDNKQETKWIECFSCGKEIEVNKRSGKRTKCKECKKIRCKICGQTKPCKRPDICKKHQLFPLLEKYFGFDKSKIGTINVYEEFDRIRNLLIEDYYINEMSAAQIALKYKHKTEPNFRKLLSSLDIKVRNFKEAGLIASKHGRLYTSQISNKYKHGWHTTWNNKQIFYRSSYELEYAQELDKQKIDYEVEKLRILYWDSQKLHQRTAIPDFYLPESNTIVEIKSNWTYDEQNMKDKFKAYKEHGYTCRLILDKIEV